MKINTENTIGKIRSSDYINKIAECLNIPIREISEHMIVLVCRDLMNFETARPAVIFQEEYRKQMEHIMETLFSVVEQIPPEVYMDAQIPLFQDIKRVPGNIPYLRHFTPLIAIKYLSVYKSSDGYEFSGEVIAGAFLYMFNEAKNC